MYIYNHVYMDKKHIIYLKAQIFLFFSEALTLAKLLKRREIFVLLNKLCIFLSIYTFKVGIYSILMVS